jgi:hypothetical protein
MENRLPQVDEEGEKILRAMELLEDDLGHTSNSQEE